MLLNGFRRIEFVGLPEKSLLISSGRGIETVGDHATAVEKP